MSIAAVQVRAIIVGEVYAKLYEGRLWLEKITRWAKMQRKKSSTAEPLTEGPANEEDESS